MRATRKKTLFLPPLYPKTQKAFGEEGRYARLDDPISLKDGMRCILIFAPEMRPNGDRSPLDFSAF